MEYNFYFRVFVYAFFGGLCGMLVDVDHVPEALGLPICGRFLHGFACFVGLFLVGMVIVKYYIKDSLCST